MGGSCTHLDQICSSGNLDRHRSEREDRIAGQLSMNTFLVEYVKNREHFEASSLSSDTGYLGGMDYSSDTSGGTVCPYVVHP